jgi:hypothetical protein
MAEDDFAPEDLEALWTAKRKLEYPSMAASGQPAANGGFSTQNP